MKIFMSILSAYFLLLAAMNVYFVSVLQSGGAFIAGLMKFVLILERPIVWILNKIPLLYVGNMHALSDITMRSSVILLCTTILLVIACVLFIRIED